MTITLAEVDMKQKKFGEKIQNWHRPLGRNQLRQRYLRQRYEDPEVDVKQPERTHRSSDVDVDDYWNCYDPYCCGGDDDDVHLHQLQYLLTELVHLPTPVFKPEWAVDAEQSNDSEPVRESLSREAASDTKIEERLAEHVSSITRRPSFGDLQSRIREAIGDSRNMDAIRSEAADFHCSHLGERICLFAPFWIRSPMRWDKSSDVPLLHHLFVRYDVPEFLYRDWLREQDVTRVKWLCWFILLGQGGSLKRAARLLDWDIPGKFQPHLWDVPSWASPVEACIFAEVIRLGGSLVDFGRIIANPAFVIDPTERSEFASHSRFWTDTVRWVIANRDEITDEESNMILDWAMHECTERRLAGAFPLLAQADGERRPAQPFSWRGRTVRSVIERSIQYRRERERPLSSHVWNGHGWDWELEEPLRTWTFTELTSGEELYLEGRALQHCVASYAARCATGYSAIVSVRCNREIRITIEITPRTRQIVQARGTRNRQATPDEQEIIRRWLSEVVLQLAQEDAD